MKEFKFEPIGSSEWHNFDHFLLTLLSEEYFLPQELPPTWLQENLGCRTCSLLGQDNAIAEETIAPGIGRRFKDRCEVYCYGLHPGGLKKLPSGMGRADLPCVKKVGTSLVTKE
jgi:hypothetical protein